MKIKTILMLAACVMLASCSNSLEKKVAQLNDTCPVSFGEAGTFTGAKLIDNKTVQLELEVNANVVQMLQSNTPMAHEMVTQALSTQTEELKDLFDEIIERGGTFSYRFYDAKGKKSYTQHITADELSAISAAGPQAHTPEMTLRQILFSSQRQFPVVTNIMTMDSLVDDGDYVRYYATVDSLFDRFTADPQSLHANLLHALVSGKETIPFVQAVVDCGKGIAYRYVNRKDQRAVDVLLTGEELDEALGN